MSRILLPAVVLPPLVVGVIALSHPASLTVEHAHHWKVMHIWLIGLFPLLALGPWLVARTVDRAAGVVVGVVAYVYATAYTTLDIVAGVVGGALKEVEAGGLGIVLPLARPFEQVGGIAFVVAVALAAGVALGPTGLVRGALPAASVVVGAVLLWQHHVFVPWGPVGMVLLSAGWGAFAVLLRRGAVVALG